MCHEAAKGIHVQCAREYWEESEQPRVTQLYKLTPGERKNITLTENLSCERYLGRFGGLASISAAVTCTTSIFDNCGIKLIPPAKFAVLNVRVSVPPPPSKTS